MLHCRKCYIRGVTRFVTAHFYIQWTEGGGGGAGEGHNWPNKVTMRRGRVTTIAVEKQ
jgi:hypothetical protein